jgi:hypothetical protein
MFNLLELGVEFYRHVPAGNIEAHARYADLIPISNHSADRLGIAKMAVSADDTRSHVSITHAVHHLADGVFVVLSNDDRRGSIGILFGRGGQGGLLAGEPFPPALPRGNHTKRVGRVLAQPGFRDRCRRRRRAREHDLDRGLYASWPHGARLTDAA